jgi:RNA polymerase sigma factor (sigma-70 family)
MASVAGENLLSLVQEIALAGDTGGLTDGQLLERFLRLRQDVAFRALVDRHGPMVMGVCRRVLHDAHDAEDAFQATFLVLVRKAASIVPRELVANWLYGVACRTAQKARVSRTRANAAKRRVFDKVTAMAKQAASDDEIWHDLQPVLDRELQRLPDKYRVAIVLCELEGKPRKQAAQQLGWPEGTLSGRLARARKLLAARLTRRGVTLSVAGLAALLTRGVASAVVPAALKSNITRAALLSAAGKAVPAGIVSAQVSALTEGVMKTMLLAKLRVGVLVLAAVGLATTGTGLVAHQVGAAGRQPLSRADGANPNQPERAGLANDKLQLADAEMHVIGVYWAKDFVTGNKRVDVEVRPTAKPVTLVLTSYFSVDWHVKLADGARLKNVIVSGYNPQEVQGVPAGVPVVNRSYFPDDGSRRKDGWFWAYQWNTVAWREMVRRLNELTGLPVASFQGTYYGESFVVDGRRGRDFGQKKLPARAAAPKEPTPQELLTAAAGAEMHVVGSSAPQEDGTPVELDVRATAKPIVLVLSSYSESVWHVKPARDARIEAVIVAAYYPQEVDGLPAGVPVRYFCPEPESLFPTDAPRRRRETFYAYQADTLEYRRMLERLNDLTGLLVSTFQGESRGTAFVVDGVRGRELAQAERKPRPVPPKEPTPQELLAAAAGAELHVVGLYQAPHGNGAPVEVEVRSTDKPIVLVVESYMSVLWRVKIAAGARVKAVIVGGYYEQEFEGIPAGIPIVYRAWEPGGKQGYFYAYKPDSPEYRRMVRRLNDTTGLLVSTFQGEYGGASFVVDGTRGRDHAQKERLADEPAGGDGVKKQAKADEDPLADVADIPSRELQAGGDADKRYFLIGPKKDAKPPAEGYGLVVILPGGDGSADFNPFVRRITKKALSDRYVVAQPIAPKWTPDQEIVWPTRTNPVDKMKFSTEEFIEAVIADVAKKHKLDQSKVFTLSWSSSGPAAYATSVQERTSVTGSLIAMSVFNPKFLPPLKGANGHAYYLYHSPQDRMCPFRMAEQAKSSLTENGAKVRLETYEGGHGWRGNVYNDIRNGIEWLEKNSKKADSP